MHLLDAFTLVYMSLVNGISQAVLSLVNYIQLTLTPNSLTHTQNNSHTHTHTHTHTHKHTVNREWTTCATTSIPYMPQACGDWELCIIVHRNCWFLKYMAFGLTPSIIRCGCHTLRMPNNLAYMVNKSLNSSITLNFENK